MYFLVLAISFYLEVYYTKLSIRSLLRAIKISYLFVSSLAQRMVIVVRNFMENHEENIELLQQFLWELSVSNVRLENRFRLYVENCYSDPSLIKGTRKLLKGSKARRIRTKPRNLACKTATRNQTCKRTSVPAKTKLKVSSPTSPHSEKYFDINNNNFCIVNLCEKKKMSGTNSANTPTPTDNPVTKAINNTDGNFSFYSYRDSISLTANDLMDTRSDSELSCVLGIELDRKNPITNIHAFMRKEEKLFDPILTMFKNTVEEKKNLRVNKAYEDVISNMRPFMETQLNDAADQYTESAKTYENTLRAQAWKDARILENMIEKKCQQIGKSAEVYQHQLSRETELKTKVSWQPYSV